MNMTPFNPLAKFLILISIVIGTPCQASILLRFQGHIDRIEYNNVPNGTVSPFFTGQSVVSEIFIPGISSGSFTYDNGVLYTDAGSQFAPPGFGGTVQFAGVAAPVTLPIGYRVVGHFPDSAGAFIDVAEFCCQFSPPFSTGAENGQTLFTGDDFVSLFLPTGLTNENVTAYGSGAWSALPIPEPASLGLLGLGVTVLGACGAAARRRRRIRHA